jgi:Ca-activated chloride channel homolog
MTKTTKSLLAILALILATTAALAAMNAMDAHRLPALDGHTSAGDQVVSISTQVVQDKILKGGDGRVSVALNLAAARLPTVDPESPPPTDLVIVLDRSGSMQGRKLDDARRAVTALLDQMGGDDRLALVTYADRVQTQSALVPVNPVNRNRLGSVLAQVQAGGGTNLGEGLSRGIGLLTRARDVDRRRKVILISDGLANQGITDPVALGRMASAAVENRFSISTVGVGLDFNELLMTAIADRGAGQYHFLENPAVFARVFAEELQASRQVAAADVAIRIPLSPDVHLLSAGGYPISHKNNLAVVRPGDLLSGRQRTLYLTFQVSTDAEKNVDLGRVQMQYRHEGSVQTAAAPASMRVACVKDPAAVTASIRRDAWADQVVQEAFSRLKEAVAADIRDGDQERAQSRIRKYEAKQATINTVVGSGKVARNLTSDVKALRRQVDETFAGAPAAVAEKKKQTSKSLQFDGYKQRRSK